MSPVTFRLPVAMTCAMLWVVTQACAQTPIPETARMTKRPVSVSATGHASAIPDLAAINTGVQTEASTAREAMSRNTVTMTKLVEGLKGAGIEAKDIHTTTVSVNPRYTTPRDGKPAVIDGYSATNQVRIVLRDMKRLGDILDTALTLGATQLGGIAFEVSKAETLKDEARRDAMVNARRRAELYAVAAGVILGEVLVIAEDIQNNGPHPVLMATRSSAAPVPVEAGTAQLDATVHVTWRLK